jgi:TPR repeat protein
MKTRCTHCRQEYDVESSDSGVLASCERCGKDFIIQPAIAIKTTAEVVPGSTVNPPPRSSGLRLARKPLVVVAASLAAVALGVIVFWPAKPAKKVPEAVVATTKTSAKTTKVSPVLEYAEFSACLVPRPGYDEEIQRETVAAEAGKAEAQNRLGWYYSMKSNRTSDDFAQAAKWFRKAAEQGYAPAQCNLALFYMTGYGNLPADPVAAEKLYRMAAEQDYPEGLVCVGELLYSKYWRQRRLPECYVEVETLYKRAIKQNYAKAQHLLGNLYEIKNGQTILCSEESMKWHILAAEQGYLPAQRLLISRYWNGGMGVGNKNEAESCKWARRAAEQGDAEGMLWLAGFYYSGNVVPKDEAEAMKLLRKSAALGNVPAEQALREWAAGKTPASPTR